MTRVFVVSDQSLFGRGLEIQLRQDPTLEVVGTAAPAADLLEKVRALRPDVLVLQCSEPASDTLPPLMCCLRDQLVARIVTLDPSKNSLCVFSGEERLVEGVRDLAEAITKRT